MAASVDSWQQTGNLHVWRYLTSSRHRDEWHFTADPAGCASIIDLIGRMTAAARASHRTLRLATVTPSIWSVPNYGPPTRDGFEKLRIDFGPERQELSLGEAEGRLTLDFGTARASRLIEAFADVAVGKGDFGIGTSDEKRAPVWMFWWMPGINYHWGKRL